MSWDALTFVLDPANRLPPGFKHRPCAQAILIEIANHLRATTGSSDLSQRQLVDLTGHSRPTVIAAQRALKKTGILKQDRLPTKRLAALWTIDQQVIAAVIQRSISLPQRSKSLPLKRQRSKSLPLKTGQKSPIMAVKNVHSEGQILTSEVKILTSESGSEVKILTSEVKKPHTLPGTKEQRTKEQGVETVETVNGSQPPPATYPPAQEQPTADRRPSPPTAQNETGLPPAQALARRRAAYESSAKGNQAVITRLAFDLFGQRAPLAYLRNDGNGGEVMEQTTEMENDLRDQCDLEHIHYDTPQIAHAVSTVRHAWMEDSQAWLTAAQAQTAPTRRW